MHEIETKVLEMDVEKVKEKLGNLGAGKIQEVMLKVDWFSMPDRDKDNQSWFLRVRSYSSGKIEVTWKGKPQAAGVASKAQEINIIVDDHEKTKMLFEAIGLVVYVHQEKKRVSWNLKNTQFDLDTYPGMPTYLEIESGSIEEINEMIEKLDLSQYKTWNDGERTLIEQRYKLNWCDMRF